MHAPHAAFCCIVYLSLDRRWVNLYLACQLTGNGGNS
jgi:hypothetical protein